MAIGPVQMIVFGFADPNFQGEVLEELQKLRESDTVRVIDALVVHKDADGKITTMQFSNLTGDEAAEFGSKVGALLGLGMAGEAGLEAGAEAGAEATSEGVKFFDENEAWDVLGEIPENTAAAVILLEHHWAVPLRNAIYRANGFPINSAFITPLDLVAIGLLTAEEAKTELEMEKATA